MTDEAAVQGAVDAAAKLDGRLRISVCCAGIAVPADGRQAGAAPLELFAKVVEVNLVGSFNVLRLAATAINTNEPDEGGERGVCISTSSTAAFEGQIGQVAYSASKGGIVGMTLPAARDLAGRGVRVVAIAPGLGHPVARRPARGGPDELGKQVPFRPGSATRTSSPGCGGDRREPDAERDHDQARRRAANGAALSGQRSGRR